MIVADSPLFIRRSILLLKLGIIPKIKFYASFCRVSSWRRVFISRINIHSVFAANED